MALEIICVFLPKQRFGERFRPQERYILYCYHVAESPRIIHRGTWIYIARKPQYITLKNKARNEPGKFVLTCYLFSLPILVVRFPSAAVTQMRVTFFPSPCYRYPTWEGQEPLEHSRRSRPPPSALEGLEHRPQRRVRHLLPCGSLQWQFESVWLLSTYHFVDKVGK